MACYAMGSEKLGIFKEGYCEKESGIKKRLKAFRTVVPDMEILDVFEEGTRTDERAIHKALRRKGLWIKGEIYYFKPVAIHIFREHKRRVRMSPLRHQQMRLNLQ